MTLLGRFAGEVPFVTKVTLIDLELKPQCHEHAIICCSLRQRFSGKATLAATRDLWQWTLIG